MPFTVLQYVNKDIIIIFNPLILNDNSLVKQISTFFFLYSLGC